MAINKTEPEITKRDFKTSNTHKSLIPEDVVHQSPSPKSFLHLNAHIIRMTRTYRIKPFTSKQRNVFWILSRNARIVFTVIALYLFLF